MARHAQSGSVAAAYFRFSGPRCCLVRGMAEKEAVAAVLKSKKQGRKPCPLRIRQHTPGFIHAQIYIHAHKSTPTVNTP